MWGIGWRGAKTSEGGQHAPGKGFEMKGRRVKQARATESEGESRKIIAASLKLKHIRDPPSEVG